MSAFLEYVPSIVIMICLVTISTITVYLILDWYYTKHLPPKKGITHTAVVEEAAEDVYHMSFHKLATAASEKYGFSFDETDFCATFEYKEIEDGIFYIPFIVDERQPEQVSLLAKRLKQGSVVLVECMTFVSFYLVEASPKECLQGLDGISKTWYPKRSDNLKGLWTAYT